MNENKVIKESVTLLKPVAKVKTVTKDSLTKAQTGKGKSFEELLVSLEPKPAKLLKALLGENTKVVSIGPGGNWVLDSPKYDKLVSVVVYEPGKLKVQYLSSGTANMLVVENNRAYVRPTAIFEKRLSEEYKEFRVERLFDTAVTKISGTLSRVVATLNRFNFKANGNMVLVGAIERGPVGEFLKKVIFGGKRPYANVVFIGQLPGGVSVILAYKDQENTALFHELFIESDSGKVKQRLLESLTKKKLEKIEQAVQAARSLGRFGEEESNEE